MPIKFIPHKAENYFISKLIGEISDSEFVESYRRFYESADWVPGMHELTDLSETNLEGITSQGLSKLARVAEAVHTQHRIAESKTAVCIHSSLQYGMVRAYESWAADSPETVKSFSDMEAARAWLVGESG